VPSTGWEQGALIQHPLGLRIGTLEGQRDDDHGANGRNLGAGKDVGERLPGDWIDALGECLLDEFGVVGGGIVGRVEEEDLRL
jgi:hypothetical protein